MKTMLILLSTLMVVVPSYALLGLEYGPALSKFYGPYYLGLQKALAAEKGLGMAHMYDPLMAKEKALGFGKAYPYYFPMLAKEKELGYGMDKGLAMLGKEKAIGSTIGKGKLLY